MKQDAWRLNVWKWNGKEYAPQEVVTLLDKEMATHSMKLRKITPDKIKYDLEEGYLDEYGFTATMRIMEKDDFGLRSEPVTYADYESYWE